MISLGVYPHVDLATARRLHADARGLLARDIDPSTDRKERRAANAHTFEVVARQWLKLLEPRVAKAQLAADTLKDATRILEREIFPALGDQHLPLQSMSRTQAAAGPLLLKNLGGSRRLDLPAGMQHTIVATLPLATRLASSSTKTRSLSRSNKKVPKYCAN
jgi:hypothetical protein